MRGINFLRIVIIIVCGLALMLPKAGQAQSPAPVVIVHAVDSQAFPQVTVQLTAAAAAGQPLTGLTTDAIEVLEDDQAATVTALEPDTTGPVDLVLALDLSLPFEVLTALKEAAGQFVAGLNAEDRVAIIVFHNDVTLIQDFTSDKEALQASLAGLARLGDSTAFNDGVSRGITLLQPLTDRPKVIVAATDRLNNIGTQSLATAVDQARSSGIRMYLINLDREIPLTEFENVTFPTGGRPFPASTPSDIQPALTTIAQEMRQAYRLTFQSSRQADNAEHTFRLQLQHEGATAETSADLTAVSNEVKVTFVGLPVDNKVGGQVDLGVEVESAASTLTEVAYFLGLQTLATVTEPPYSYHWDSTSVDPGSYDLSVRVVDSAGNQGETTLTVEVIAPVVISLEGPLTPVQLGDQIPLTLSIEALNPISTVEILLDGQPVSSSETGAGGFSIDSSQYQTGPHVITVRATDNLDQVGEASVPLTFIAPPPSPPTPIPTPIPEPQPQGRPAWFKGVTMVILGVAILAALAVMIIVLMSIYAGQRQRSQKQFQLEIANLGNIRSRYELRADDPAEALTFQFLLNGTSLHQHQVVERSGAETNGATQAISSAQPAQPARAVNTPQPPRPPQAAGQGLGLVGALVDILSSISMILPRSIGGPFQSWVSQYRRTQSQIRQVQRVSQRVSNLTSGGSRPGRPSPPPAGSTTPSASGSNPAAATSTAAIDHDPQVVVYDAGWTPPIEPGQALLVDLLINPIAPYKRQHYPFTITSQSLEDETTAPVVEEGNVTIQGLSRLQRLWLPTLVVIIGTIVTFTLILFLLMNIGIWTF